MRWLVGVLLILLGPACPAAGLPAATEARPPLATSWRRTCDGWERADWFVVDAMRQPPALHPAVVSLLLFLFALAALLGLSPDAPVTRGADSSSEHLAPDEYTGG
jgi:hypothetical protein